MKKVLVVEDDRKISKALEIRLRNLGVNPIMAYDAVMGLNTFATHNPDIVIMDISMPAGNGFEIAKSIQSRMGDSVPIIFITASKKYSYKEQALELGAAGFFEKPFDSDTLMTKVARYL